MRSAVLVTEQRAILEVGKEVVKSQYQAGTGDTGAHDVVEGVVWRLGLDGVGVSGDNTVSN
jgi:hypothetical protein